MVLAAKNEFGTGSKLIEHANLTEAISCKEIASFFMTQTGPIGAARSSAFSAFPHHWWQYVYKQPWAARHKRSFVLYFTPVVVLIRKEQKRK